MWADGNAGATFLLQKKLNIIGFQDIVWQQDITQLLAVAQTQQ